MAQEVELKPGWLECDTNRAAYTVAAEKRDAARDRFKKAQRAAWAAEREWDDAEREVQRLFVEMARLGRG